MEAFTQLFGKSGRRGIVLAASTVALTMVLAVPVYADAARQPSKVEFKKIRKALKGHLQQGYYCPKRANTRISSKNHRWAMTQSLSNCGLGSQTVRHYVSKTRRGGRWRFREMASEALGTGKGAECGSRRVPSDIRCGLEEGEFVYSSAGLEGFESSSRRPQPRVTGPDGTSLVRPRAWSTRWTALFDETSYVARKIRWRGWGSKRARGRGRITHCVIKYEPCHTYRGRIQFRRIVDFGGCGGVDYPYYTQVKISGHGGTRWMTFLTC